MNVKLFTSRARFADFVDVREKRYFLIPYISSRVHIRRRKVAPKTITDGEGRFAQHETSDNF